MLISGICRRARLGGFTLLEMLVTLAIVALLAGISLPNMYRIMERSRLESQRKAIMSGIENLGYRAYLLGKPYLLTALTDTTPDAPFPLPIGWKVTAESSISFAVNGVCQGGYIRVTDPQEGSARFFLRPPDCRAEAADEG